MAVKCSIVCLLVFVLIQATQDAPFVSAANLFPLPPVTLPNLRLSAPPLLPTVSDITKGITDALRAPPLRIPVVSSPPLIPHVSVPSVLPTVSDITKGITDALRAPPLPIPVVSSPPLAVLPRVSVPSQLPTLSDLTKGVTDALGGPPLLIPGVKSPPLDLLPHVSGPPQFPTVSDLTKGVTDALGAPPLRIPGVNSPPLDLLPHVSGPPQFPTVSDLTKGVTDALNVPPVSLPTAADLAKGIADAFSYPSTLFPGASVSTPKAEQGALTTVTQTYTFSLPGLTTTLTVTAHIPAPDLKIPDVKSFLPQLFSFSYGLPSQPNFPLPSTISTTSSTPATGFPFPKFPGTN